MLYVQRHLEYKYNILTTNVGKNDTGKRAQLNNQRTKKIQPR